MSEEIISRLAQQVGDELRDERQLERVPRASSIDTPIEGDSEAYKTHRMLVLADASDQELNDMRASHAKVIDKKRADLERRLEGLVMDQQLIEQEMFTRLKKRNAKFLSVEGATIELVQKYERSPRIDVLKKLIGRIPADRLKKALWEQQPPTVWKTHATQLDKLATDFGGEIAEIVADGCPKVAVGSPRLVITPHEAQQLAA